MLKKTLAIILTVVCIFTYSSTLVFADTEADFDAEVYVEFDSDTVAYAQKVVDKTNEKILKIVLDAQESKKDDAQEAVEKTNKEAQKAIEKCAKVGVVVICEYTEYEIDGHIVLIDPLKVIRF